MPSLVGASASTSTRAPLQRVRDALSSLGGARVWARAVGHHVLLGLQGNEAFARLTPLGGVAYGLAFRAMEDDRAEGQRWEPMFLVDELRELCEHALVAADI